ncbi:MAG: hypothetical protein R3C03_18195 [Pirellulaceae bacterium]
MTNAKRRADSQTSPISFWIWCVLACIVVITPGCGGCVTNDSSQDQSSVSEDDTKSDKDKKPKQDYEAKSAVLYPGEFADEATRNRIKPGHWVTGAFRGIANNADASGELIVSGSGSSGNVERVPGTRFGVQSSRPASLPKGQEKLFETLVMLPYRQSPAPTVSARFTINGTTGLPIIDSVQPVVSLKPYQYHFIALVDQPESYKYLRVLDCIEMPTFAGQVIPAHYHIVYPTPDLPLPLAGTSLAWTTIAYMLWDDLDPDQLSPDQQLAMIDWLHFGGQLIISGPGSLDRLQNSFLAPYLPARSTESVNLSGHDFDELNENWSTPILRAKERKWELRIPESSPILGARLEPTADGYFFPGTGELVAERMIGRGRIVVTAFTLNDLRLKKWGCISSFFHNVLMRRPQRNLKRDDWDQVYFAWSDTTLGAEFNPVLGSSLRYLSRDLGRSRHLGNRFSTILSGSNIISSTDFQEDSKVEASSPETVKYSRHYSGFGSDPAGGVATWNDEHGIAQAAHLNIIRSAGIRPPKPAFVLKMLGVYLLILVPVNWLIFRLAGRVEFAWAAMPIISIAAAIALVKLADLDIGFVRSRAQIGVLELQGGFSRGHLTEYSALYSSLSTHYQMTAQGNQTVFAPFGGSSEAKGAMLNVTFERQVDKSSLSNFLVSSNSTGLVHRESISDVGGAISLADNSILDNQSNLELINAAVIRRQQDGSLQVAKIGNMDPHSSSQLDWRTSSEAELYSYWTGVTEFEGPEAFCTRIWQENFGNALIKKVGPIFQVDEFRENQEEIKEYLVANSSVRNAAVPFEAQEISFNELINAYVEVVKRDSSSLGIGELFGVVKDQLELAPGSARLIARTNQQIDGVELTPAVTQDQTGTLIVVHLQYPEFPEAKPDNSVLLDWISDSNLQRRLEESIDTGNLKLDDMETETSGETTDASNEDQ